MLNEKDTQKHKAEIGYWLAKPYRGQGIMTAVVKGLVEHVFNTTPLTRLDAMAFAPNIASQKILEKAGFEREGFAKKYVMKPENGNEIDVALFGKVK